MKIFGRDGKIYLSDSGNVQQFPTIEAAARAMGVEDEPELPAIDTSAGAIAPVSDDDDDSFEDLLELVV